MGGRVQCPREPGQAWGPQHMTLPGAGALSHTGGRACILPAHTHSSGAVEPPNPPRMGGRGLGNPGFRSAAEASRRNNSLIPLLHQGQGRTGTESHSRLLPVPGCPGADLLLLRSQLGERGLGWDTGLPVLPAPQPGFPHLMQSALIFDPHPIEFQSWRRPSASPHPRSPCQLGQIRRTPRFLTSIYSTTSFAGDFHFQ